MSMSFHIKFLLIYIEHIFLHFPKSKLQNQLRRIFLYPHIQILLNIILALSVSYSNTAFQSLPLSAIAPQFCLSPM